jgi:hypothetical protein
VFVIGNPVFDSFLIFFCMGFFDMPFYFGGASERDVLGYTIFGLMKFLKQGKRTKISLAFLYVCLMGLAFCTLFYNNHGFRYEPSKPTRSFPQ